MEEGDSTITCVRCRLIVFIALEEGGLRLKYDFDRWRKGCCCALTLWVRVRVLSSWHCKSFSVRHRAPEAGTHRKALSCANRSQSVP